ncbi:UBA-like domain-containing protein 1 isoform X1 [Scophthalmus maximus]|uniref:UBA-like domain-containing protein 1 isoform X1 n=1 Tax=Scophthalmus maximus TaxID=52904 RepID=UPI0015E0C970|nr:UBA-like domain-containing protein 1 isoform X1 [Scophthalmus maximus]
MARWLRGVRSSVVFGTRVYCVCPGVCSTKGTPGSKTITALAQGRVGAGRSTGECHTAKEAWFVSMCTPANTPATPPNFPDALTMFSRLKASESFNSGSGGSPMAASMATSPPPPQVGGWGVSPNVPQPPQGLWTQGQPPTQPCPAWPTGVNPHVGAEQKASVAMEAER